MGKKNYLGTTFSKPWNLGNVEHFHYDKNHAHQERSQFGVEKANSELLHLSGAPLWSRELITS